MPTPSEIGNPIAARIARQRRIVLVDKRFQRVKCNTSLKFDGNRKRLSNGAGSHSAAYAKLRKIKPVNSHEPIDIGEVYCTIKNKL